MRRNAILLYILAVLFTSACKKEIFMEGAAGAKGEQGLQGNQGLTGANGNTIHSGTGAPSATLGAIGDFYLDKNTAQFYGPKAANGWPTPLSLKGNPGAAGADGLAGAAGAAGAKILSGTSVPSTTLGNTNDYYFDTVGMAFYGPKTANGWGAALTLLATNNISTFAYNNQSFADITRTDFEEYEGMSYADFSAKKLISINHQAYINAYNTGMVMVRYRFSDDVNGVWTTQLEREVEDFQTRVYTHLQIFGAPAHPITDAGIHMEAYLYAENDPAGLALTDTKFDVRITCIPAGTVVQMKAKNVDVKDAKAVANYLSL